MITHQFIPETGQLISSQLEKHGDKTKYAIVVMLNVSNDTQYAAMVANEKRLQERLTKETV